MDEPLTPQAYTALSHAEEAIGYLRWIIARIQDGEHHLLSKYEINPVARQTKAILQTVRDAQ